MFEIITEVTLWGLAAINITALSVGLFRKVFGTSKNDDRIKQKRRQRSDAEFFAKINPYLLGVTYAYSAYRFISHTQDAAAYAGTCFAGGQLYLEYKKASATHKRKC